MVDKTRYMKELIFKLNEAGKAYYQGGEEIMSNLEYDALYDELRGLEEEMGTVLAGSPTQTVGYEVLSALPKENHEQPMLSLDKTKDINDLVSFLGNQRGVLSWKLDGLTVVLNYQNGSLVKAVTRGNGEVGEVITSNAKTFTNIPLQIAFKGSLVLRGEALIGYQDFENINLEIEDVEAKYKNPRNLCSGSVRQLNSAVTASRRVQFYAFSLVEAEGQEFANSRYKELEWLKSQGFDVVDHYFVDEGDIRERVATFAEQVPKNDLPSDGLVLIFDDIAYGKSLGRTAKFPKDSIAFKWKDEQRETILLEVEWSPSRTGLINPVAIFEPVELEGTTVSRASVHNLSVVEELALGIGDTIIVYKANMIIPQIAANLTRSGQLEIPKECPVCASPTEIRHANQAKTLYCVNPDCQVKQIKSFGLMVSRNALNIEGLSEATLEKMVVKGFIKEWADLFHLASYEEEIKEMEGFGEKSFVKLVESAEKARETALYKVVYGLGIPNVGLSNAKVICKELKEDAQKLVEADFDTLCVISGVGEVIAKAFVDYFQNPVHIEAFKHLLQELRLKEEEASSEALAGLSFVVTGALEHFPNRGALKERIESCGGKVTGSVTAKTDYLVNNDVDSKSSKNQKAKALNIPILSEGDFLEFLKQREV